MNEKKIDLLYPVTLATAQGAAEPMTSVTLGRMTGRDLVEISNAREKGIGDALRVLVSRSARLSLSVCDKLDAADLAKLGEAASEFLGPIDPLKLGDSKPD